MRARKGSHNVDLAALLTDTHLCGACPNVAGYGLWSRRAADETVILLWLSRTAAALRLWPQTGLHGIEVKGNKGIGVRLTEKQAHIKSALIGNSVSIPITNGELATGTWQGIWYLEFRRAKHSRRLVATIQGQKM